MTSRNKELLGIIGATLAAVVVVVSLWVGASYLEARAFNNVTGKSVSTFDAMFINLRVQESASED